MGEEDNVDMAHVFIFNNLLDALEGDSWSNEVKKPCVGLRGSNSCGIDHGIFWEDGELGLSKLFLHQFDVFG